MNKRFSFIEQGIVLQNDYALWTCSHIMNVKMTERERVFLTLMSLLSNEPDEIVIIADKALEMMKFGLPLPVYATPKDDAQWWAARAMIDERKAFLVACFRSIGPLLQRDFVEHAKVVLQK